MAPRHTLKEYQQLSEIMLKALPDANAVREAALNEWNCAGGKLQDKPFWNKERIKYEYALVPYQARTGKHPMITIMKQVNKNKSGLQINGGTMTGGTFNNDARPTVKEAPPKSNSKKTKKTSKKKKPTTPKTKKAPSKKATDPLPVTIAACLAEASELLATNAARPENANALALAQDMVRALREETWPALGA